LLTFGGSQGARAINEGMENALPVLKENNIQAIWQTGKHFYQRAKDAVEKGGYTNVKVTEFIEKMNYAYAAADLVVSRAGAIAVAELAITGKACILVPLPTAAEDHQTKNAMALVNRNAALLLRNENAPQQLGQMVKNTLSQPEEIQKLEYNIGQFAMHEAAKVIASEVIKLVKS
jgi:UDP-N-acetylglucosamine--N-acetylmuramyl-(pentapeptide) pyrophosphoryl-undecaprenol N-acetylglucosamine transferase